VNRTAIRVGLCVIIAGTVLFGLALFEKNQFDYCMGMIKAFERGENVPLPVCPPQPNDIGFYAGFPIQIVDIIILIGGIKGLPVIPVINRQA